MDGGGRCLGREFNVSGPSWAHTSFKKIWSYHVFVKTVPKRNVCKFKTYARSQVPAFLALTFVLVAQVLLPVRVSDLSIQQNQIKNKMHVSFSTKWLSLKEKLCTQ